MGTASETGAPYFVSLIFHDQQDAISSAVNAYEAALRESGLPDIPFHMEPLLYAKRAYENIEAETRMKLLDRFHAFVARCPIAIQTFQYGARHSSDPAGEVSAQLRADVEALVRAHHGYFLKFDHVKAYYDRGQSAVSLALQRAFEKTLARTTPVRPRPDIGLIL